MLKIHDDRIILGNLAVGPVASIPANTKFYAEHDTEGSFQLGDNGYLKNIGLNSAYLEYNHNDGRVSAVSTTHSVTGYKAMNTGQYIEMLSGAGKAYFNTNTYIEFYANNTAIYAGTMNATGLWGFGGVSTASTAVTVNGYGATNASNAQIWKNSTPTELMRLINNGVLAIGINTEASLLGTAQRLNIYGNTSTDYAPLVIVDQTYSPVADNSVSTNAQITRLYKANNFNTLELRGQSSQVRNDGTGAITYMHGHEAMVWSIGAAAINSAFAYSARAQIQAGTVTNFGGVDVSFQEVSTPANITNMIGVFVRTPVNVGTPTVANTYGLYIQDNSLGTNNYGIYQIGSAKNYFNGHAGFNVAPSANDVLNISSSSKTGAINIAGSNMVDGGYGILAQMGAGGDNIYGFWADITTAGTGNSQAFRGSSSASGGNNNYGGYFVARNGTLASIGVYGLVSGGDTVNSTDSAAGYFSNQSIQSTSRKGGWCLVTNNVDNGTSYGFKSEVDAAGTNAINYGYHANVNGSGATVTNYGLYVQASGGSSATNYAIVTNGGLIVFGAATSTNGALVEVHGDIEVIGRTDGIILEDRTLMTRHRVYLNSGALVIEAA
jgi:hypothetical protein